MAWRWYVYRLVDPRDKTPFYIGKGCGSRIEAHEREARRQVCSLKAKRIRDIQNSGNQVVKEHIAYFHDETDAYRFEASQIEEIGMANLTNACLGGRGRGSGPSLLTRLCDRMLVFLRSGDALGASEFLGSVGNENPELGFRLFMRVTKLCVPRVSHGRA